MSYHIYYILNSFKVSGSLSFIFLKKYSTTFNTATKAENIKLQVFVIFKKKNSHIVLKFKTDNLPFLALLFAHA